MPPNKLDFIFMWFNNIEVLFRNKLFKEEPNSLLHIQSQWKVEIGLPNGVILGISLLGWNLKLSA